MHFSRVSLGCSSLLDCELAEFAAWLMNYMHVQIWTLPSLHHLEMVMSICVPCAMGAVLSCQL